MTRIKYMHYKSTKIISEMNVWFNLMVKIDFEPTIFVTWD